MNFKNLFVFCLFFALLTPFSGFGQENKSAPVSDLWQWTDIGISKKITQRWTASIEEEIRLMDNITEFNLIYTNFGISYKLSKVFKAALTYRWIEKARDEGPLSARHRLIFDVVAKEKVKHLVFAYRFRLQGQVRDYYSANKGPVPETYMRNKLEIKYDLYRNVPYIAVESRYQFHNPRAPYNNGFDRMRYYFGVDHEFNRVHSAGLYYMIQRDFNMPQAEHDYVIGVAYTLTL